LNDRRPRILPLASCSRERLTFADFSRLRTAKGQIVPEM
jgi:hypothetical protein